MKECEQIHAMIFTPLPTASATEIARGSLITLHPNREYAFAFLVTDHDRIAQNYSMPTTRRNDVMAVEMAIVGKKSLHGTRYANNPDLLHQEIDRAFTAGASALEIRFNDHEQRPEIFANELNKVVQQSPRKFVMRDDVARQPRIAKARRHRGAQSQPR